MSLLHESSGRISELVEQLAALRDARAKGVQRVVFKSGDTEREVWFRSDDELRRAEFDLTARIAAFERGNARIVKVATSKGF